MALHAVLAPANKPQGRVSPLCDSDAGSAGSERTRRTCPLSAHRRPCICHKWALSDCKQGATPKTHTNIRTCAPTCPNAHPHQYTIIEPHRRFPTLEGRAPQVLEGSKATLRHRFQRPPPQPHRPRCPRSPRSPNPTPKRKRSQLVRNDCECRRLAAGRWGGYSPRRGRPGKGLR